MPSAPYRPEDHCIVLRDGKFDSSSGSNTPDHVLNVFAQQSQLNTLAVHFHGGLVSKEAGLEIAERLTKDAYSDYAFPIFFVWQSGLLGALAQNLPQIFGESIFQRILEKVTQFAIGKIDQQTGGRGDDRITPASRFYVRREIEKAGTDAEPFADRNPHKVNPGATLQPNEEQQFRQELEHDPDLQSEATKIANSLRTPAQIAADAAATRGARVEGSTHTLMSPDVLEEMRAPGAEGDTRGIASAAITRIVVGTVRVLAGVIRRFGQHRDHGVQATIVEEILREFYIANVGKIIWDTMKRDTLEAFGADPSCGGTALLVALGKLWQTRPPRLVLIGHSTGAIYICHLLEAAAKVPLLPDIKFDIVLLAPACDFKLLSDVITRHKDRIANLRSFGMRDALERKELLLDSLSVGLLKKFYPGSLLYFVSGLLEDEPDKPLVGMERYYAGGAPYAPAAYPEIAAVHEFLAGPPDQCVWSRDSKGSGLASSAVRHGDFDNDQVTLASLSYILQSGFK